MEGMTFQSDYGRQIEIFLQEKIGQSEKNSGKRKCQVDRVEREENTGKGYADFTFHPRRKNDTAFIVELKKDEKPEIALKQIRSKEYVEKFKRENMGKKILAVAICYDSKEKEHHCLIEEIDQKMINVNEKLCEQRSNSQGEMPVAITSFLLIINIILLSFSHPQSMKITVSINFL